MKKTSLIIMLLFSVFSTITNAETENIKESFNNKETINITETNKEDQIIKEKENCFKFAYIKIKEFHFLLDEQNKKPDLSFFEKVKKTNLWNNLNKENKKLLAEKLIKWNTADIKEKTKIKSIIAEYYNNLCKNNK